MFLCTSAAGLHFLGGSLGGSRWVIQNPPSHFHNSLSPLISHTCLHSLRGLQVRHATPCPPPSPPPSRPCAPPITHPPFLHTLCLLGILGILHPMIHMALVSLVSCFITDCSHSRDKLHQHLGVKDIAISKSCLRSLDGVLYRAGRLEKETCCPCPCTFPQVFLME